MSPGIGLEELQDARRRVREDRQQGFVHEGQTQFRLDWPVELIGHFDRHPGFLAGRVGLLLALQRNLQFPLDGEAFARRAKFPPVDGCYRDREVREVLVVDLQLDWVETLVQVDQTIVDDLLAFESHQRQRTVQSRVQADRRLVAYPERRAVGEQPQLHGILRIGDHHRGLASHDLVEAVLARGSQHVQAAPVEV